MLVPFYFNVYASWFQIHNGVSELMKELESRLGRFEGNVIKRVYNQKPRASSIECCRYFSSCLEIIEIFIYA